MRNFLLTSLSHPVFLSRSLKKGLFIILRRESDIYTAEMNESDVLDQDFEATFLRFSKILLSLIGQLTAVCFTEREWFLFTLFKTQRLSAVKLR